MMGAPDTGNFSATKRSLSSRKRDSAYGQFNGETAANKYYDKNLIAALDKFKGQVKHMKRLQEIREGNTGGSTLSKYSTA